MLENTRTNFITKCCIEYTSSECKHTGKGKGTSFRSGSVRGKGCIPCYNMIYMQAMGGQESEDLKIIINLLGMHLSQLVCCLNQEEGLKYATPLSLNDGYTFA